MVKWRESAVDLSPPSSAKVKNKELLLLVAFMTCRERDLYIHKVLQRQTKHLLQLEMLLLHRAFRRITSVIKQQLHLHKFHIETLKNN